ncbi:hypothetical protein C8Q79DRAFT_929224 [Trametes meyenii]|nr:hypothetical protein C8Q79DRAFT_929224 [Trametes meyenii]
MNHFPSHYTSSDAPFASQDERIFTGGHTSGSAAISTTYHQPAPTGDLEYPYYQTLLRFERELESNYLASTLVYPSDYGHTAAIAPSFTEVPHSQPAAAAYDIGIPRSNPGPHSYVPPYAYDPYGQSYTDSGHASQVEQPYYAFNAGERYVEEPAHTTFAASGGTTFSHAGPSFVSTSPAQSAPTVIHPTLRAASYDSSVAPSLPVGHSSVPSPRPNPNVQRAVNPPPTHTTPPVEADTFPFARLRRRRSSRSRSGTSTTSAPYPPPAASSSGLVNSTRRNTAVSPATTPIQRADRWKCPYCPYVQQSHRSPDLKRHIATHTRSTEEALWVCCGVPLIDAREAGVPEAMAKEEPFEYEGMFMVGGCRKVFSRRDALSRHLRKYAGECFGDAFASYLPGNKVGAR